MKRRYPVIAAASIRAAADGRSLLFRCAVVITDAVPHPAAAAVCSVPGRARRRDPPGVRSTPGDWRAPQAGYLQEATPDTHGPSDGAAGGLCCAPQRCPRPGSPRSPPWPAHRGRAAPAGGRSARAGRPGRRRAPPRRSPPAAASWPLREASRITVAWGERAGQTLTRVRPLRRRAARTARPALVRMRSRNPCVFARRRLFGWNVRLLTGAPGTVHIWMVQVRAARPGGFSTGETDAGVTGPMHVTRMSRCGSNGPPSWPRPPAAPAPHRAAQQRYLRRARRDRALGCG